MRNKKIIVNSGIFVFCLPVLTTKNADNKTLELLKERRRVYLTLIKRPVDGFSEAQLVEVNSTIRVCGKNFLNVGAATSLAPSNKKSSTKFEYKSLNIDIQAKLCSLR